MRLLPLLLLAACAHRPPEPVPADVRAWQSKVDWTAAGAETAGFLSKYLAADTSNPPGNEIRGVEVIEAVLDAERIEHEKVEWKPDRPILIARLRAEDPGDRKPLCLLSHVDVATVETARWTHEPFSGELTDGEIWGRGALDMKGMGAIELYTMVLLKRGNVPLERDIILLAVPDEEVGNGGAKALVPLWDSIGCDHMINEGGVAIRDLFNDGQTVYPISVAEKGHLWVKMVASGEPGHGSTPRPGQAPEALLRALDVLERHEEPVQVRPAMRELVRAAGREHGGLRGAIMRNDLLFHLFVVPAMKKNPPAYAAMHDTINITGFEGRNEPNVVPSEVSAILDCRLLPDEDPAELLATLVELVDDERIRFEVLESGSGHESPTDDEFYRAIARNVVDEREDVVAGPLISIGSTDSDIFRPLGVRAYGMVPFALTFDELATMHGDDERIRTEELTDGLRRLYGVVVDYAARE